MDDFKNIPFDFNDIPLSKAEFINPAKVAMENYERQEREVFEQIQMNKEEKEEEELRRHNELINALKAAGKNGAKIIIGDNANDVQIQQNATNSNQSFTNTQTFDYEKALDVLKKIKGCFSYPQFSIDFAENSEVFKQLVERTISSVEKKEEPTLIKKSLGVLKDLSLKAGGSLLATGILGLLKTLIA